MRSISGQPWKPRQWICTFFPTWPPAACVLQIWEQLTDPQSIAQNKSHDHMTMNSMHSKPACYLQTTAGKMNGVSPWPSNWAKVYRSKTSGQTWFAVCWRRLRPQKFQQDIKVLHGCFQKSGKTPKWMVKIMENPMNKWMIWGYHYFWKHPCV